MSQSKSRVKRNPWDKQFHVFNVEMFDVSVGVFVNMTRRELDRAVTRLATNKKHLPSFRQQISEWDDDGLSDGQMCRLGGGFIVLLRVPKNRYRKSVGLITHEMTHVAQYLLRERRTPLTQDTEEVYAYLTQFLVERTLQLLW